MQKNIHILNGDCLNDQFPSTIVGDRLIMRECLIDGNCKGDLEEEFFKNRIKFFAEAYNVCEKEYTTHVKSEFDKLKHISIDTAINLWFEDDLFCQVNMWFIVAQLQRHSTIFLIRPKTHNKYGFGGLSNKALVECYKNRTALTKVEDIALLWKYYSNNTFEKLKLQSQLFSKDLPFIAHAVQAHLNRQPDINGLGQPERLIMQIVQDLNTTDFKTVFNEFQDRAPIYGFGDLQLKTLYDKVIK